MKIETDKTKNKPRKILCCQCKHETNHIVLASINAKGTENWDDDGYFQWETDYEIVQCRGCDEISFRMNSSDSESYDEEGGYYSTETIFPKRTRETINIIFFHNLPYNINRLYQETINCYNNDIMTLCAAGVRALVEGICLDKNIKDGEIEYSDKKGPIKKRRIKELQGRINGLMEKGIITKEQTIALHEQRYLGNEAIHELSIPSKNELSLAIHIIEDMLKLIYELPDKTSELQRARNKNKI
jgi:hypothetical protein